MRHRHRVAAMCQPAVSGGCEPTIPMAAASLSTVSALCLQTAAEFSQLTQHDKGAIGLIVTAVPGSTLHEWVPADVAATHCNAGHLAGLGKHYNSMLAPFSMTTTRAALWALDNSSTRNTDSISGATEACLFRAMINGWRDAQQTGDYSFIFAQSPANDSLALAMAAALPSPSPALVGGRVGSGGFPDDGQVLDTTGVAVRNLLVDSNDTSGRLASLAHRMALALVNVAFAKQPRSASRGRKNHASHPDSHDSLH